MVPLVKPDDFGWVSLSAEDCLSEASSAGAKEAQPELSRLETTRTKIPPSLRNSIKSRHFMKKVKKNLMIGMVESEVESQFWTSEYNLEQQPNPYEFICIRYG